MTLIEGLVSLGILGGFGYIIWMRLVKRNHPMIEKSKDFFKKKEKSESFKIEEKWQQPNIEKKIY